MGENERIISAVNAEARRRHMSYGRFVFLASQEDIQRAIGEFRPAGKKHATRGKPPKPAREHTGRPRKAASKLQDAENQAKIQKQYTAKYRKRVRAELGGRQRAALLEWMRANGYTQKQAAKLLNMTPAGFGNWCMELVKARWDVLEPLGCHRPEGL